MIKKLEDIKNKTFEGYPCLLSMCETNEQTRGNRIEKRKIKNIKHRDRKKKPTKISTQRKQSPIESTLRTSKNLSF